MGEKSELYLVSLKAETFLTEVWYLTLISPDPGHCQGIFISSYRVEILCSVTIEDSEFLRNTQSEGNVALTEGVCAIQITYTVRKTEKF
jgi:hypothetical protein